MRTATTCFLLVLSAFGAAVQTDLTGTWTASLGGKVEIRQTGSQVRLTNAAGLAFTGELLNSRLRLVHKYGSPQEIPGTLPIEVKRQLVGTEVSIVGTVDAANSRIEAEVISLDVKFNPQTFAITSRTERRTKITFTRQASADADAKVIQYHETSVTIRGSNLPSPVRSATFSDPAVSLVRIEGSSADMATLRVYADAGATGKPVDVTLEGSDGRKQTLSKAIQVRKVAGTIMLLERIQPSKEDRDLSRFDFDVSVRILTLDADADPNRPDSYKPLEGCKVALGLRNERTGTIGALGNTLGSLARSDLGLQKTDSSGRVFARIKAVMGQGEILLDASFGDPIVDAQSNISLLMANLGLCTDATNLSSNNEAFRWHALRNAIAGQAPRPPDGDLVKTNYGERAVGMQEPKGPTVCERIATGIKDGVTGLVFSAIAYTGFDLDPTYQIIRVCVKFAKAGYANTAELASLGFDNAEIQEIVNSANRLRNNIGTLLQADEETLAKAIYGGFVLGGVKGSVSAGFDQTIGLITDLGAWLEGYIDYARKNPVEALTSAGKTYLTIVLWVNPFTAPIMATRKLASLTVSGFKWLFSLGEEAQDAVEKIDPVAFASFLFNAYRNFYTATANGVALTDVAKKLIAKGILANFEAANFVFESADGLLPGLGDGLQSYATQLNLETNPESAPYKLFTGAYLVGMGSSYVITFVGIEVVTFIVTDGVGTYVKGVVALRRLKRVWDTLNFISFATVLIDVFKAVSEATDQEEAHLLASIAPFDLPSPHYDRARAAQMLVAIFYVASRFMDNPEKLRTIVQSLVVAEKRTQAARVLNKLVKTFRTEAFAPGVAGALSGETSAGVRRLADKLSELSGARVENWATLMEDVLYGWARRSSTLPGADPAELKAVSEGVFRCLLRRDAAEADEILEGFATLSRENPNFLNTLLYEAREHSYAARRRSRIARNPRLKNTPVPNEDDFHFDTVADAILHLRRSGHKLGRQSQILYRIDEFIGYLEELFASVGRSPFKAGDGPKVADMMRRQFREVKRNLKQVQVPDVDARRAMRALFDDPAQVAPQTRTQLIAEWERRSGVEWPKYDKTIFRLPGDTPDARRILCTLEGNQFKRIDNGQFLNDPGGALAKQIKDGTLDLSKREDRSLWVFRVGDDKADLGSVKPFESNLLDAHHIVELQMGGRNEWWNIVPLLSPSQHQGGVHGANSLLRQLIEDGVPGDILRFLGK